MKKIYILFVLFIGLSLNAQVPSTCSISPLLTKAGIWPDSVTNFISGTVGVPYFQNITIKVSKDTSAGPLAFCFTRFELSNPGTATNYNLPPGLSMNAGPSLTVASGVIKIPAQAASCAWIGGTPTTAGTYTLQLRVQAFGTPKLGACATPPNYNNGTAISTQTLTYYIIQINPAVPAGIKEQVNSKTLSLNASPNPANHKTIIKFNVNDVTTARLKVYNLLGEAILDLPIETKIGENSYDLNLDGLSNGMYLYSLNYKNYSETKRLIVGTGK